MLTKSKYEIAEIARRAAKDAIRNHTSSGGWAMSDSSIMGQLADMVSVAVEAGIMAALENIYTNEEFERDIGLKP